MTNKQERTIGVIQTDEDNIDEELRGYLPEGVKLFSSFTPVGPQQEPIKYLTTLVESPDIEEAARRLIALEPDSIAYVINSASFIRGPGYDEEISDRIEKATGVPATTTSTAMVRALKALGIEKVAVGTPYGPEVNRVLEGFLANAGLEVVKMHGLDVPDSVGPGPCKVSPEDMASLVREIDSPEADALYLGCTSLRTANMIDRLEGEVDKPVVTANQATMWDALRIIGMEHRAPHLGELFRI